MFFCRFAESQRTWQMLSSTWDLSRNIGGAPVCLRVGDKKQVCVINQQFFEVLYFGVGPPSFLEGSMWEELNGLNWIMRERDSMGQRSKEHCSRAGDVDWLKVRI